MEKMKSVSRRRLMQLTAVGGAGAALAGVLAACGEAAEEAVPAETAMAETAAPAATAMAEKTATAADKGVEAATAAPTEAPVTTGFKEAPEHAAMVASGSLPPVEERLPKDPRVIDPFGEIGQYGGRIRLADVFISVDIGNMIQASLHCYNMTGSAFVNDVAKNIDIDVKPTGSKFTVELREGHKWSDGAPFTTDDIMFYWNDWANNKELRPGGTGRAIYGGLQKGKVEPIYRQVSENVFEVEFEGISAYTFMDQWGRGSRHPYGYQPKHYMEQFHIDFNPDANKLAEDEGLDNWVQLYNQKASWGYTAITRPTAVGLPVLEPWMMTAGSDLESSYTRNPYYHWVDTDGNQLPYVEGVDFEWLSDKEVYNLRASSGELDYGQFGLDLKDMPVYQENADAGQFKVHLAKALRSSILAFMINQTYNEQAYADLFRMKDFRVAMSVAIDRTRINDTLFFGQAVPSQVTVHPSESFFKLEWQDQYTEHDPDRAIELLDTILPDTDSDGFRTFPNGDRVSLFVIICDLEGPKPEIAELVKGDWANVGVEMNWQQLDRNLCEQRIQVAGETMIGTVHSENSNFFTRGIEWIYGFDQGSRMSNQWGQKWAYWFSSGGSEGEEPPQIWKDYFQARQDWKSTVPGTPEYDQTGTRQWQIWADELPLVGTVGLAPQPTIVTNRIGNFPADHGIELWFGAGINFTRPYRGPQWYIKQ